MAGLPRRQCKGCVISQRFLGVNHLLNLVLEPHGEFRWVAEVTEVLSDRLLQRFFPERQQCAVSVCKPPVEIKGVDEVRRVGKRCVEPSPQPQLLIRFLLTADVLEVDRKAALRRGVGLDGEPPLPRLIEHLEIHRHPVAHGAAVLALDHGAGREREDVPVAPAQRLFTELARQLLGGFVDVDEAPLAV